jgi:predicted nucleotidyltransferase
MHLNDEQLATIITWAKTILEVEAVFLRGSRARGTAKPDSDVDLALSIAGADALRNLATFISHRRAWRAALEATLGLAVVLERARREPSPDAGYIELWRRA